MNKPMTEAIRNIIEEGTRITKLGIDWERGIWTDGEFIKQIEKAKISIEQELEGLETKDHDCKLKEKGFCNICYPE